MIDKEVLERIVGNHVEGSQWKDDHNYRAFIESALDRYQMRPIAQKNEGRSDAQDTAIPDMIEAIVAQMLPAFDHEVVAAVRPNGSQDVDQAKLETAACNATLRDFNAGLTTLQEALRNALLLRNGILCIEPVTTTSVSSERIEIDGDNPAALIVASTPRQPGESVEVINPRAAGDNRMRVTIRRTVKNKELDIKSVGPENFILTKEHDSIDTQNAACVGHREHLTRSDLIARGIPKSKVNQLGASGLDTETISVARNKDSNSPKEDNFGDPSQDKIECFFLSIYIDQDEDGVAERRRILYVPKAPTGLKVLENRIRPDSPYACGTPYLYPQRWMGLGLADKLGELTLQKTEVLRQWHDNLAYANNAEVIANENLVNVEDLKRRRPGGINRSTDPANAVAELKFNNIGGDSQVFLQYLDQQRGERGGAALDMQQAGYQLQSESAHGAEREQSPKELLVQLMTKTLGETLIKQAFEIIHRTLRVEFPDQLIDVQAGNSFVQTLPGQWQPRRRWRLVAGMTWAQRQEQRLALEMTLGQQEKLLQSGLGEGILTNLQTYHDALVDWSMSMGVRTPGRHWIDPRSQESLQAQQRRQQAQEQAQAQQQAMQDKLFQTEIQGRIIQAESEMAQNENTVDHKYWSDRLDAFIELLKMDQAEKLAEKGNDENGGSDQPGATSTSE